MIKVLMEEWALNESENAQDELIQNFSFNLFRLFKMVLETS
jgi:hypothetical protein